MTFEILSETTCFGGRQGYYRHQSSSTNTPMQFSVFTPPGDGEEKTPVVWYLSGLTCTEDNATVKAGFQRIASELGLIVVCPDTSPRGPEVPDDEAWDFGQGAGFYLDATQIPWIKHYKMYSYVTGELPALIETMFPADMVRQSIMGHSMGGHGALTIFLKNRDRFRSVSAFAPIVSPISCPWGRKALGKYIGRNENAWQDYDACALLERDGKVDSEILIDQGLSDPFLKDQLMPNLFEQACSRADQALMLRLQKGYDHSYFFVSTFIEDHLRHHYKYLTW